MTTVKPAGRPDTARPAIRRAGAVVAVRISNTTGDITVTEPLDPWLDAARAAELAGMTPGAWRTLVSRGYAPVADDPGDLAAPANRRSPKWRRSTVYRYMGSRRNSRGKRTEEQGE